MWEKGPGLFLCLIAGVDGNPNFREIFKIIYIELSYYAWVSEKQEAAESNWHREMHMGVTSHSSSATLLTMEAAASTLYNPSTQENLKRNFFFNRVTQ